MNAFLISLMKVAEATPLLLDGLTNVAVALDLRKIKASYSGPCIRIRASIGGAETDIGFVSGELNAADIATHCGAGDGFVVTWYDQSGNGKHYSQATTANQPKIYESGALLVDAGGKPRIKFDGSNDALICTDAALTLSQPHTSVHIGQSITGNKVPYGSSSNGSFFIQAVGTTSYSLYAGTVGSITMNPQLQHIVSVVWNGASSLAKLNGNAAATKSLGTGATGVNQVVGSGAGNLATYAWNGYLQAVYLFSDAKDATNLTTIHTDINSYYAVY